MSENTDKRNATQKIEDLEKVVTMLYQAVASQKPAVDSLLQSQGEMNLVKDALRILNKKTEAIIQVANPETGITVKSVSDLVIQMNVTDLKAQVDGYIQSGHLTPTDEVTANSYLVCEELNTDGTTANPRIQFRLDSQDEATSSALLGKKVGDTASFGENRFSAKLLEIYTLTEPKAPEAPAVETAPAEATPEAAPAEEAPAAETTPETTPDTAAETVQAASAPLPELPAETPIVTFVASEPGNMLTANS
jgi:hypothetical protein